MDDKKDNTKEFLHLLSQYRHDVMNQVQLLKGYLQLQKYDRLHSPLETLIEDAQRHSALSNLPGTYLPYRLIQRELSAPLLHLNVLVENRERYQQEDAELRLLELLEELAESGESAAQDLGISVKWQVRVSDLENEVLIELMVLGEHVNDTYIEDLLDSIKAKGWKVRTVLAQGDQYKLEVSHVR
jgi:stage 0 sporulation protein B (sporulation initiation phosphotransferase)